MAVESIFGNLLNGKRLSQSEACTLWEQSNFLDLGSFLHKEIYKRRSDQVQIVFELELQENQVAPTISLLETYNIFRKSIPHSHVSWIHELHDMISPRLEWKSLPDHLTQLSVIKQKAGFSRIKSFDLNSLIVNATKQNLNINDMIQVLKKYGIDEIESVPIELPGLSGSKQPTALVPHIWFELQQTIFEQGMTSSLTIDLNADPYSLFTLFELVRDFQDDTKNLISCKFLINYENFTRELLDRCLKIIAISNLFFDKIPLFEITLHPTIEPYLCLFKKIGIKQFRKKLLFPSQGEEPDQAPGLQQTRHLCSIFLSEIRHVNKVSWTQLRNRYEMNHVPILSPQQNSALLLYKVEKGKSLTETEMMHLAYKSSLWSLGQCTNAINAEEREKDLGIWDRKEALIDPQAMINQKIESLRQLEDCPFHTISEYPIYEFGYLDRTHRFSFQEFLQQLRKLKDRNPTFEFSISGIKGLWQSMIQDQVSLNQAVQQLKELGLNFLTSSPLETEQDLTNSEVAMIHRSFHEEGIPTMGQVELVVPYHGIEVPFWDRFCQRLTIFKELEETTNLLRGIAVTNAPGCRINLSELLRSVALTRIYLNRLAQIQVFFDLNGIEGAHQWDSFLSIALPLLFDYGMNDIARLRGPHDRSLWSVLEDRMRRTKRGLRLRSFSQTGSP